MCFINRRKYEQSVSAQSMPSSIVVLEVLTKRNYMFINVVRWILDLSVFLSICFYHI
jgi:hypothetical protein